MSRSGRNYLVGGRNSLSVRRGVSLTGGTASFRDADENLDLFSRNRRSVSVSSSDASSLKLGILSVGSAMVARNGVDDLLSSTEGKNDYDWLLTPPGTPQFDSSDKSDSKPTKTAPKASSLSRSTSTTKASRLSVPQSEVSQSSRPTRSSSATRASSSRSSSSILNTSSASVSSYIRPSSPITRSPATPRPSTSSTSRPSTPSRIHPAATTSSNEKPKPPQSSRPSTPTRRNSAPSLSQATARVSSNGRSTGPPSRSSSSGPRLRPPQQPIIPSDFPLETPPNLRTTLPSRPLSAGRSRPTVKGNSDRRQPSPVVTRGRMTVPDSIGRGRHVQSTEPRKASQNPVKTVTNDPETTGFGRNISKKSLDMAIRHMDLRNGPGSLRALPGTNLFPHSIQSSASKSQPNRDLDAPSSLHAIGSLHSNRDNGRRIRSPPEKGAVVGDMDVYESSRYDAILLKEDSKNTNWLHGVDYKSDTDAGSIFDSGFEPLPEPFLR